MRGAGLTMGIAAVALVVAGGMAWADVTISTKPTQNMSCQAGVCSPTAADAVLNVSDLANMLGSGDAKVTTGSGATNIVVKAALTWANTSRLTLDANQSVEIDKPVVAAGAGAVTITTNDGGTGGDLIFDGKGNVTFWDLASSLVIKGDSYTLVSNIATLASDIAANASGFYALANDYDASVDGTYTSAPITTELAGTFEGLGHAISKLKIVSPDLDIGLFASARGNLRDIGLLKASITARGSGHGVGTLLARSERAAIAGCYATGSIVFDNSYGGGGLVGASGFTDDGTIMRSHTSVTVSGGNGASAGGLVGVSGFSIFLSYATGGVSAGDGSFVGGVVGIGGSITRSYATGNVAGGENSNVGGVMGAGEGSIVTNTYATGAVKGGKTANVGGFAGEIGGLKLQSSYSTGHVKGGTKNVTSGGFIGVSLGSDTLGSDYWDTETSGKRAGQGYGSCQDANCGRAIKGLTTETFQSGLPEGFDPNIWGEKKSINGGYPYLLELAPR